MRRNERAIWPTLSYEAWVHYAKHPDLQEKPRSKAHATYMLCSKFFARDCFTSAACKRLTRGAVPSVKVQEPRLRPLVHLDLIQEIKKHNMLPKHPLFKHDYC
ncbi:hypothetical protein MRX96_001909 [Rhipicephalus microplus]